MQLRTRLENGDTPPSPYWGIDSEYGRLTDLLVGPIDNYSWQPGNAVAQRTERQGIAGLAGEEREKRKERKRM